MLTKAAVIMPTLTICCVLSKYHQFQVPTQRAKKYHVLIIPADSPNLVQSLLWVQ